MVYDNVAYTTPGKTKKYVLIRIDFNVSQRCRTRSSVGLLQRRHPVQRVRANGRWYVSACQAIE